RRTSSTTRRCENQVAGGRWPLVAAPDEVDDRADDPEAEPEIDGRSQGRRRQHPKRVVELTGRLECRGGYRFSHAAAAGILQHVDVVDARRPTRIVEEHGAAGDRTIPAPSDEVPKAAGRAEAHFAVRAAPCRDRLVVQAQVRATN